jgi:GTP-binding protein EngB required for normal cell division
VQRVRERYVVAIVGLSNVGKSTLINALLGQELAPRRNGPCTSSPVEFAAGTNRRISAYLPEDFRPHVQTAASNEELRQVLNEHVDRPVADPSRQCTRVVVELDHELLSHGLVLADTPGFGAAQLGEHTDSHEQAVLAYLQESVSQVFWVVLGEQGIGQREREFYDRFLRDLCDDIIVTRADDWDDRDRQRFRRRYHPVLAHPAPAFHFVGQATESLVEPVAERIRALQSMAGRLAASRTAFLDLAEQLADWLREHRVHARSHVDLPWRPDSWTRLGRAPACAGLRDHILQLWSSR